MKQQEIEDAVARAQIEINDQLNAFKEKLAKATDDPEHFISMSELESEWQQLRLSTCKTYSDLVSKALSSFDNKRLNAAKKANSSRKGSN